MAARRFVDTEAPMLVRCTSLLLTFWCLGCQQHQTPQSESQENSVLAKPNQTNGPAEEALAQLSWVENWNMEQALEHARAEGDHRLMAFTQRSRAVPGVAAQEIAHLEKRCGLKYMPGTGDVIRSPQQLEKLNKAREIAMAYNQAVLKLCAQAAR